MRIQVRQPHIDWAEQQERGGCAIAQAIRGAETMESGKLRYSAPKVDRDTIRFTDELTGERYVFKTPSGAVRFIDDFDISRDKVRPFTFTLSNAQLMKVAPKKYARAMEYATHEPSRRQARRAAIAAGRSYSTTRRPLVQFVAGKIETVVNGR